MPLYPVNFTSTTTSATPYLKGDVIMPLHCLPKQCQPLYLVSPFLYIPNKEKQKTRSNSVWYKLVRNSHQIFPTAKCASHGKEFSISSDDYKENGLRLPGIQVKRKTFSQAQKFGEFEVTRLMETESGWDRVKYMYRTESGLFEDESTQALNKMLYRTVIIGFLTNAIVANLKQNTAEKSLSKIDAMRKGVASQGLKSKAVLISALKDTAKLSVLALSLLHVSQTIAAYRNKTSVWEYTFSSAVGFGVIGLSKGLQQFCVFTAGGAFLGSIIGLAVCNVLTNAGLTQELRSMKRVQQRLQEERMQNDIE